MKKTLLTIVLAVSCLASYAQPIYAAAPITNGTGVLEAPVEPTPKTFDTGSLWTDLSAIGTNLMVAAYGIYDMTSSEFGAGVALVYDINNYVGTSLRYDYINSSLQRIAGTVQLQVPVTLFGKFKVIPFVSAGMATAVAGKGKDTGEVLLISGVGAAVPINRHWAIVGNYEVWAGNKQVRLGALYKF